MEEVITNKAAAACGCKRTAGDGVKVKAPKDALRLIERIAMLDAAYERLDYELGIPAKVEAWDGKSAVPTKLDELEAKGTGVSYSLATGRDYFSDKDGNPVSFAELIEWSRQGHEELFAELMKTATPEMREAVANIEAVLEGKLDKGFRYRDLTAEEVDFFKNCTGVDFSGYEWRIIPRALNQSTTHTAGKREWGLTATELKLLPYFIDNMMQNKDTLAVSLGDVNAKGVRSLTVEVENPITKAKIVFEVSSKKHSTFSDSEINKKAPRLSLSSAKMLLLQRAGLAPARAPHSVPSGNLNVTEKADEVKRNLLKQEFSSKDTSINSSKAPAVFGVVDGKLGGWQNGTVNIDIGGGKFDTLTQKLAEKGVTNYIYEPFGRSINENAYILAQLQAKTTLGDTATCSNVLNVIKESDIRANVVHQVAKAIKPEGVAYFTIYEGDKSGRGKQTKDNCWQNNRKTATYVDEVKQHFGDVQLIKGVIVAREPLHVDEPAVWKLGADSETDFTTFSLGRNLAAVQEMEAIKAAAVADGTFMKAPNGKPSNLNERQWLQVRTAAFKEWFGDWENAPENASKAVDENGEPKVYYHHTNAVFSEFLHDKKGKTDAGWLGSGFYFYGIEDEGKGYGKNVMACFLNVREPYYATDEDMFRLSESDSVEESESFTEELKESGYDGVYYNGDLRQEMMVFEPNQIKSATDNRGTFDGGNADITFSVIGPKAATWDKYADRAFKGRDDGMLRAEIDASQAKLRCRLKPEAQGQAELIAGYRRLKPEVLYSGAEYERMSRAQRLWQVMQAMLGKDEKLVENEHFERLAGYLRRGMSQEEYLRDLGLGEDAGKQEIKAALEAARDAHKEAMWEQVAKERMSREVFEEALAMRMGTAEERERLVLSEDDWVGLGETLGDILDYPELYRAYPALKDVEMVYRQASGSFVRFKKSGELKGAKILLSVSRTEEMMRGSLLHEVQHLIQVYEDFGFGGTARNVGYIFASLGRAEELSGDSEKDYKRLAGEVEARAVNDRKDMTAAARLATPFNESLEYPGEALAYRISEYEAAMDAGRSVVSFSVIGQKAKTWDKYTSKAFKGRDDGLMRAEIDASGAKIKGFPNTYPVQEVMRKLIHDGVYDREENMVYSSLSFVEDITQEERGETKLSETELKEDCDKYPDLAEEVELGLKAAGLTWESKVQEARGACFTALSKWKQTLEEELERMNIEKPLGEAWHALVEQKPGLVSANVGKRTVAGWSGKWLDDVLDFPELFEAYPQLRNVQLADDYGLGIADASYSEFARKFDASVGKEEGQYPLGFINLNPNSSAWGNEREAKGIILHEVQHAIQDIEGFAKGTDTRNGRDAYLRSSGEIEARNVQARRDWTMDERLAKPFNETLEYPGEALVTFSIQGIIADWNMEVDNFVQNPPVHKSSEWRQDVYVCPTPAVMRMVGAAPLDIVMSHHVLAKVLDKDTLLGNGKTIGKMYPKEPDMGKHKMTVDELRKLPIALTSPVCIAESNRKGSIEVITDMQENGVNVLVAVQLEVVQGSSQYIKVNRIASLYGKEKIEQLVKHPMLYVNTAKAHKWLVDGGLQLPTVPNLIAGSKKRVLTPTDLVKYKFANGLSFSLSGRGMIDAAQLGKMSGEAKMQRLLNYARKEAGRWTRTFGKDTPNARAAEAMGTVSSILASIHKELPPRFRPRVEGHMRYVEVYARLLESGKVRSYGRLSKEQRAAVEAELLEVLQDAKAKADAEYELAKKDALDAAELTGEMAAMEAAEEMDVDDEVKRAAYLDRLAKRTADATRRRLLAEVEAKKQQLEADIEVLKRDFAAEKLAQIASRMLNDAADAVEAYLIDEELGAVDVLMERLAPRKLPNGKYDKGRMSADAYRKFVSYVELMNKSKGEVDEKLVELGLLIAAEAAKSEEERMDDGAKLDALTEELAAWSTYGGLRGKNLEGVRKGVAALGEFAAYEKNAWSSLLKLQRNRAKRQALVAAQGLGGADEFKVKEETEKQGKLLQRLKDLGAGLQSIGQIFYGLGGVPEMRALVDESLDALSAGHVALASREKRAFEQLAEYMEAAMGLKTERQRNNWMAELKKKHKTSIYREGELVRHRLRLTLDEAAVWLEMSKAERDAKRAEMEAVADKQGVLAENVPYEEDIPLIREELRRIQEEESSAKYVRTVREFRKDAPKEPMVLSKDEALNILLLCEQADYVDAAHENGYTDEVLAKLAEFVGNEVLGFGYAMREVLENNGLAEVYEAREGVPFPKVNNYWPGHFDQSARVNEQANALDPTSGGGTRYGMLITRVKHKLKFNLMGASNVFMAALAQQNNYICMGELTAKWRRLLSHNDFAMALKAHLGVAQFKQFKELIELLDGAGVQESITQQTLSGLLGQFQSAHAMAVLAGSPITLVKQLSAMMNAGAWEGISCSRVLARIVLDRFGGGAIKYGDMLQKDYFKARYRDKRYFTEMMQLGRDANWSVLSSWARGAMGWIEKMDVLTNCASMTALYNITYHDFKQRNEGAADALTEEEIHAECDRVVRNTLELGAQPLRRTQKSAFAALSRNALVKATCYMGSEALNKLGMTLSMKRRTGGGAKGFLKAWKYLAGVSIAQQVIVMLLDMARNADPVDEDEWAEWLLLNLATGASGLGLLQSVPVLGEAVQKLTGGYVKTGSLGQMIYDFEGMWRSGKKVVTMAADEKDDSWADWAWAGADLGRRLTFLTGAWGGINSSSKGASELAGLLQSLNAMANTVRPVVQAERNDEKRMKAFRKKVEKGLAKARKATREREKQEREAEAAEKKAEREKREKAKRREERLKRL